MPNLDSTPTTPNSGTMPSGSSSWSSFGGDPSSGGSSFDWGGLAEGASPFIASLFGGTNTDKTALRDTATKELSAGKDTKAAGAGALSPVLKYLQAIAGGDPAAVMDATAPQRARILDQYDTARKAITQQPRGGGQASAALNLEGRQASDLATTAATARSEGVKELGTLGTNLTEIGAREHESGMSNAMRAFASLSDSTDKSNSELGSAIGAALPMIFGLFGL